MFRMKSVLAAGAAALIAMPTFAGDIMINDAYARASGMNAKAGAAFFQIMNHSTEDDRLIAAKSDAAKRVELHTHKEIADGVMKMMEVEEGFPIAAGGMHALKRGGDHVMFMGLQNAWSHGDTLDLTLVFEQAGEINIQVPVDLERQDKMMHSHN